MCFVGLNDVAVFVASITFAKMRKTSVLAAENIFFFFFKCFKGTQCPGNWLFI